MICHARLPIDVPLIQVQAEVRLLTTDWHPHFNKPNYEGDWSVLSLRSPSGAADRIIPDVIYEQVFADTPLMHRCPVTAKLIAGFNCPVMAVRLMRLRPGSFIKEHRDFDLSFENGEARLHIPVFTNDGVVFNLDGEPVKMYEGGCWYVNANLPHSVSNSGVSDRIHLVIDCMVNDWLKEMFVRSERKERADTVEPGMLRKIIHELRMQHTATADKLAEEMERELEN